MNFKADGFWVFGVFLTPTEIGGKLLAKLLLKNLFSAKGKVFIASYWILLVCHTRQ